jgi:uncharacterized protein (DUF1697 family)
MARYAALLRGVNVNGITVKSAELATLFRDLGFDSVKTVLASGNVLFETPSGSSASGGSPASPADVKAGIEKGLGERFGYDAWIVLVDHASLQGIVDGYPFDEVDERQPYVVFASDDAVLAEITAEAGRLEPSGGGERAASGAGVLYWEVPRGSSTDTPFSKYLAKSRFKAHTTTRNLRTLRKLL